MTTVTGCHRSQRVPIRLLNSIWKSCLGRSLQCLLRSAEQNFITTHTLQPLALLIRLPHMLCAEPKSPKRCDSHHQHSSTVYCERLLDNQRIPRPISARTLFHGPGACGHPAAYIARRREGRCSRTAKYEKHFTRLYLPLRKPWYTLGRIVIGSKALYLILEDRRSRTTVIWDTGTCPHHFASAQMRKRNCVAVGLSPHTLRTPRKMFSEKDCANGRSRIIEMIHALQLLGLDS